MVFPMQIYPYTLISASYRFEALKMFIIFFCNTSLVDTSQRHLNSFPRNTLLITSLILSLLSPLESVSLLIPLKKEQSFFDWIAAVTIEGETKPYSDLIESVCEITHSKDIQGSEELATKERRTKTEERNQPKPGSPRRVARGKLHQGKSWETRFCPRF